MDQIIRLCVRESDVLSLENWFQQANNAKEANHHKSLIEYQVFIIEFQLDHAFK